MNPEPNDCTNGYWMATIIVNQEVPVDRERLLAIFKENNIDGRVFFWPLSMMELGFERPFENPVSYGLYERGINLPCYHDLTESDADRVAACVRRALDCG
jgi:perosamine synthetase